MTQKEMDYIGSLNMCDEISNEAYKKIMAHCEDQEPCDDTVTLTKEAYSDLCLRAADYEARKAEPCEDCISRQATSDHIKNRLIQTAMNNMEDITTYEKVCVDIVENRLDTWLNELPSVKPERKMEDQT